MKAPQIEIPSRVAFVNVKDGSVFFDCTPAEARLATVFVKKVRLDKDHAFLYKDKAEIVASQVKAALSCRKRWLAPEKYGATSMPQELTSSGLNCMFRHIEMRDRTVNAIFVNAYTYATFRCWGKTIYEECTSQEVRATGALGGIWAADIVVRNNIKNGHVILTSLYKNVYDGIEMKRVLTDPEVFRFRLV